MLTSSIETLRHTFGFDSFRPHQSEIVEAILQERDVFAALPTGGGKSLCYQLPSLLLPRLTVVISPLIALMQDQVRGAREYGIPAAYLNSTLDAESARQVYREVIRGETRLLYISPERLSNPGFRNTLSEWGVSLFAVDEAHCISEWGHEFRPDYRTLATLRESFPGTPIIALTATATHHVQDDVIRLLGLREPLVIRGNFDRPEILYRVQRKTRINRQILDFVRRHRREPGIVYRATRKSVEETSSLLETEGISAAAYHAGLSDEDRAGAQERFVRDEIQVVVATIAFGMGIDKSNVRWVVHGDLPRSLEAYYQETGRSGRDGEPAEVSLFYAPQDIAKIRYHIDRMQVPQEQERAERNLREVLRYVDAGVCRRTQLLHHFDQIHHGECGRCDICLGESPREDRTVPAQKLMSAVLRTGERFGAHHIVDILHGERTDRVLGFGHDRLPTFSIGADQDRTWWLDLARDLEAAGLLVRRDGTKSGLKLSDRGRRVLFGRETFLTTSARKVTGKEQVASPALRPDQEALFECLRALRLRLAREQQVPPYVIFSDRTLRVMAINRPENHTALLRVHGVGDLKAERYGPAFIQAIRSFLSSGRCAEG